MKKIFIGAMSLALIISLTFTNSLSATGKNLRIAMLLWRGETKAERGFKGGLKDLGYSVEYTIMNAGQDRKELRRILNNEIEPTLMINKTTSEILNFSIPDALKQKAVIVN